jgi:Fe-S-cluster formation regulator IscX/YfhJ
LDHVDPVKEELPSDVFNKICNALLDELEHVSPERFQFLHFRDLLYNMTIYHLDILESLTYVLVNAVRKKWLPDSSLGPILSEIVVFLKWYNNNYRTIYHIERIFFFLFIQRIQYKESLLLRKL